MLISVHVVMKESLIMITFDPPAVPLAKVALTFVCDKVVIPAPINFHLLFEGVVHQGGVTSLVGFVNLG